MKDTADLYRVTDTDVYVMGKGEWFRSYEKLGAHPSFENGEEGFHFAVWAPPRAFCVRYWQFQWLARGAISTN